MTETYFRQTDEFHVVDLETGAVETVFEFTELQTGRSRSDAGDADPPARWYNLRRGATRIFPQDDGTFVTEDGTRRLRRA